MSPLKPKQQRNRDFEAESRPLKIVRLVPVLDFGGVESCVVHLAKHLDDPSVDLRVCTFWKAGDASRKVRDYGIPVDVLDTDPAVRNPRATLRLFNYLTELQPDIVHSSITEANFHLALAGTAARIPIRIVEEVGDPTVRSRKAHLLVGMTMHLASHCIGVSRPSARYIHDKLKVDESKVFHIDNGVEPLAPPRPEESAAFRQQYDIPPDALVIGSVGRLDEKRKRYTDLIDALALLHQWGHDAWLVIVGDGPDRELLRRYTSDTGIEHRVVFTDFLSDVRAAYGGMDIFSLLSEQEAFGLVVAEAMFCNLPVVVTSVGGMKTVVAPDETGYTVPTGNPRSAAEQLERLVTDENLRLEMGRAGRKRALDRYAAKRYTYDILALYRELRTEDYSA